jgi:hypothetical protein
LCLLSALTITPYRSSATRSRGRGGSLDAAISFSPAACHPNGRLDRLYIETRAEVSAAQHTMETIP